MHVNHSQFHGQLIDAFKVHNTQGAVQKSQCWSSNHIGEVNIHNSNGGTSIVCDTEDRHSVTESDKFYVICDQISEVNSNGYYPVDKVYVYDGYGNVYKCFSTFTIL